MSDFWTTDLTSQAKALRAERDALASTVTRQRSEIDTLRAELGRLVPSYDRAIAANDRWRRRVEAFSDKAVETRELLEAAYHQLDLIYLADGVTLHPGCVSTLHDLYAYLWPHGKPANATPEA